MDDEKTLRSALEAIMAGRRDELGEPPSPDELLAYRDGTLPPAGRALVEEKIATFPEAAAALLDLARFPDVPPAPGVRQVTDDEIADDWPHLLERMERQAPTEPPRGPAWTWRRAAILAGVLLLGAFGGLLLGRGPFAAPDRPATGTALVALEPDVSADVTRSGAATIDPAPPHLLVLSAGGVEPYPAYSLTIRDAGGRPVWSEAAATPTAEGLVTVHLPARFLAPGRYRIELSPPAGGEPLATFTLFVASDDAP